MVIVIAADAAAFNRGVVVSQHDRKTADPKGWSPEADEITLCCFLGYL